MKKIIIILLVIVISLFSLGCNRNEADKLDAEVNRLNEIISLMEQISKLEKEIELLQNNKANSEKLAELERELWVLNNYIEKVDQRTRGSYDWDKYIYISYPDLVHLQNNDYEKLVYEFENHIFALNAWCTGAGVCDDGYEYIMLSNKLADEPQIALKTIYNKGETLSFIGKSLSYLTVFQVDKGFTLARIKDDYYFKFPEYLFTFANIKKPEDIHYGTLKETLKNEPSQVYIDINLKTANKYFIEENKLDSLFETVEMPHDKTITITLKDNELTQSKFISLLRILAANLGDRTLIIRA